MISDLFIRLRYLFRRSTVERELDDELRFHLEHQTGKLIRSGLTREEAWRQARLEFGGFDQIKQTCREARGVTLVETFVQDVHYAFRGFGRNFGFVSVAVMTLALGVGANTAVFSVINAVMLRTLPVHDPARLVQVAFQGKHDAASFVGESFSYPLYRELRKDSQAFSELSAFDSWDSFEAQPADYGPDTPGEPLKGQLVSANFFSMLGLRPSVGRTFAAGEESGADGAVAVISHDAWEREFALSPDVIGKKLVARGSQLTIIGVAPKHFSGVNPGKSYGVWIPLAMASQVLSGGHTSLSDMSTNWLSLMGRLSPGVSAGRARQSLDAVYQQLQKERDISEWPAQEQRDFYSHRIVLLPAANGADYLRKEFSRPLSLLMGMVGLVLLIACANTANLLLARASTREREIAVRVALGARRMRVMRQLLTESVLLSLIASSFGILLAFAGSRVLVSLMSITLDVRPDLRVLAFTLLLALITGISAGIAPAISALKKNQSPAMGGSFHTMTPRVGIRLCRILTVMQIATSLVVVVGAALLARTLRNLESLDPGFSRKNVLLFKVRAGKVGHRDEKPARLYQDVADRLRSAPGIRSASYSMITPISGGGWDNYTYVQGYTPGPTETMDVFLNAVGPGFFETLGTPLLVGRDFDARDTADSGPVAVINQSMARRYFAGRNPIGQHIGRWKWNGSREYQIVAVAGDAKYVSLREEVPPTAYLYMPQIPEAPQDVTFEVNGAISTAALADEVRTVLAGVGSRLPAEEMKSLAQQVDESLGEERLVCAVSVCFAVLGLVLACIGLYGVMAYLVTRRTNEIGLRMALGAERGSIFRMIVGEGVRLAVVGLSIGVLASLAIARILTSFSHFLYGVRANDPATIILVSAALLAVAVIACYVPGNRAMRVDPMVTLRYE
jgi:predicted permease